MPLLQVCEMDVSKQLQAYEVEYHVLQDELLDTPPTLNQHQRAAQLERTNQSLRQQNLDLLEELQVRTHTHACTKEEKLPLPVLCSIRSPLLRCSHPGVPRSSVQPGESSGGFGPGRGAAEGAGFCTGGGEEAAAEHHHTPPGPPLQPRDKRQPRRTGAAFTVRLTDSHSSIKAGGQRAAR